MRKGILALCCAALGAGCGGAQIRRQQDQIKDLRAQISELEGQLKDKENQVAALEKDKADDDSKVQELSDNLKSAQGELDQQKKNNEDLSQTAESSKGELAGKVKQLIKEKGELAAKLNEAEKARASLSSHGRRAGFELAKLAKERDAWKAELDKVNAVKAAADKARSERLARTHEEMGTLADAILKEIQSEDAKIDQEGGVITLTLQEPLLFPANQAKLTDAGAGLLDRLGAVLKGMPARDIHIQGHTDNAPIKWELFGRFTSHWDLSAAQAIAAARYLHEHAGLDPMKLLAEGYGEFRPAKSNGTAEGRAANRRLVLVIEPPQS
ncbi:MAG: OmpA family protein [Elusimicrobia bacterium]|nr:OmpA family protein [Elusimicrobiota bacterium]